MKVFLSSLFICALTLCVFTPLYAQTAQEIESLLATDALSCEQAARFVLQAADVSDLTATEAFSYAIEQKWLSAKTDGAANIKLNEVSLLIMRAFDIKGGIMYSAVKNPHYAYRELVQQNIIQGKTDPSNTVSGEMLLFMIGRVLERNEGENP